MYAICVRLDDRQRRTTPIAYGEMLGLRDRKTGSSHGNLTRPTDGEDPRDGDEGRVVEHTNDNDGEGAADPCGRCPSGNSSPPSRHPLGHVEVSQGSPHG